MEIGDIPGNGRPFGDIFQVQTPELDRIAHRAQDQMAQLNLMRQQSAVRESQQLDNIMSRELANVRSVDMPSVMDAYNKYKQLKQQSLFNKKLISNPQEWNKANIEANAALGEAQSLINKSKQLNDFQKGLITERKTKYNLFADDFGDKVNALANTPADKLSSDYTNPDFYRYKGSQTDFGKIQAAAAGVPKQTSERSERLNNLQTRHTPILFGNTPQQYFDTIKGNLGQRVANRDAAAAWESIPDAQKMAVDQQYAALPEDKFKDWGMSGKPMIAPTNPNDPAENYAAYLSKLYAINATPKQGRFRDETDQQAKLGMQFQQKEALEAMRQNNRTALKNLGHTFKQMDENQQSAKLDDLVNGMVNDAKNAGTYTYKSSNGKVSKQYEIKLSPFLKDEFKFKDDKGHNIYPDALRMNEDGTEFIPLFYKEGSGENRGVNSDLSKPITPGEFKAIVGKALLGVKEASKGSNEVTPSQEPAHKPKLTKGGANDL